MSLNRIASLETYSFDGPNGSNGAVTPEMVRTRRPSNASVGTAASLRGTRVTFNPLPDGWDPRMDRQDAVQAVSAFEVARWKRIREGILGKARTHVHRKSTH